MTMNENIQLRLDDLKVEFETLEKQRLAAADIIQKVSMRQMQISGAMQELKKLIAPKEEPANPPKK